MLSSSRTIRARLVRAGTNLALAVAVFPLAAAAVHATDNGRLFPSTVYTTLQSTDAVEAMPTGEVWNGLSSAHYVAVGPRSRRLLVSSKDLPEVYLVDVKSGKKLATFDVGPVPQGVAISPDGTRGIAVGAGNGTVSVIDMEKRDMLKTIKVGKVPHNARFSDDGTTVYVTLQGASDVAVVDMHTLRKSGEIPVPGIKGPHNLDLSADGKTLWVRDLVGHVAVIDIASQKELAVVSVGLGHAGIDVIPGGRYVATGAIADHVVDVIDSTTFKVVKRIDVGQGPHGVRASRDGRWLYAGITGTDKVAVIDMQTLDVVRQVPVDGKVPFWIAVPGND